MSKRTIRLKLTNGLEFGTFVSDVLAGLRDEYEFVESEQPEFAIFACDGGPTPPPSRGCVRVSYSVEHLFPDFRACDWAFGVHNEEEIGDSRYRRIPWRGFGLRAEDLVKREVDVEAVLKEKTGFCNFVYANPVPYRERFAKALARYKRVDSPGASLNNMPAIQESGFYAHLADPAWWNAKRMFLRRYKFTIAFENYSYPGYDTEKIVDAMHAGSIPIYFGNPQIGRHFNPASFVNGHDYVAPSLPWLVGVLEARCRWLPQRRSLVPGRITRRLRLSGMEAKMRLQCPDFGALVERIIQIDRDDDLYARMLREPCYPGNAPPSDQAATERWRHIFEKGSAHA